MSIRRFSSRTHRLDASFLMKHLAGSKSYKRIAGYFTSSLFEVAGEVLEDIPEVKIVCNVDSRTGRALSWFAHEPASMPVTEMTRVAGQYDYTLTLLLLPEAEWQGARHDDEEPEEDTFDRFIRNGQYPVR